MTDTGYNLQTVFLAETAQVFNDRVGHIWISTAHERRQRGSGRPCPPWIFIHGTDKLEKGLMVLFFGLIFSVTPNSENFSSDALGLALPTFSLLRLCMHET